MGVTIPDTSRRGFLAGLGKVALGGAGALLLKPEPVRANGNVWWENSLNQTQRNQAIVNAAWPYIGQWGGQCKEWIQRYVVYPASRNHVWLPQNAPAPNDYYWQADPQWHAVGMSMPVEYVQRGHIIQMRMKSGISHTAIVYAVGSSLALIESNWFKDEKVHIRTVDFSVFRSQVSAYTVYYIQ